MDRDEHRFGFLIDARVKPGHDEREKDGNRSREDQPCS